MEIYNGSVLEQTIDATKDAFKKRNIEGTLFVITIVMMSIWYCLVTWT